MGGGYQSGHRNARNARQGKLIIVTFLLPIHSPLLSYIRESLFIMLKKMNKQSDSRGASDCANLFTMRRASSDI